MSDAARAGGALRDPAGGRVRSAAVRGTAGLAGIVALLPLWWVLGVEQLAYPLLLLGWVALVAARRRRLVRDPLLLLAALYLASDVISVLFVESPRRYVSFAQAFGCALSAVLALLVVRLDPPRAAARRSLGWSIVGTVSLSTWMGLAGAFGVWRPQLGSLLGAVLPGWIRATDTGAIIATRTVGEPAWFLGRTYFRASGMFLYGNMLAVAIVVALVWAVYLARAHHGAARWLALASTAPLLLGLVFTTSRLSLLALVVGGATSAWLAMRPRRRVATAAVALAVALAVVAVAAGPLRTLAERTLYARGAGSPTHRMEIYRATVAGALDRPLFGWGTVRDTTVPGLRYPAGSHSFALGTLYKHGLVGTAVLLVFALWSWRRIRRQTRDPALRDAGTWLWIALGLMSVGTSFDLDATVMLLVTASLAVILAAGDGPPSPRRVLGKAEG